MQNQKAHKPGRKGAFKNIQNTPIVSEYRANINQITSSFKSSRPNFLNQTIVNLVKSFIHENKPDSAMEVLEAIGFRDGLAELLVSAIRLGVLV